MPGRDGTGPRGFRKEGRGLGLCQRRIMPGSFSQNRDRKGMLLEEKERMQQRVNQIDREIKNMTE